MGRYVQQLSWTDDMMLRAERPETPIQIQMLLIYDPSTAPGGRVTYKGILEEIGARLHLAPMFRRRLTECPAACTCRTGWTIPISISNTTSVTSRCRNRETGVSCASRSRASTLGRSTYAARRGR